MWNSKILLWIEIDILLVTRSWENVQLCNRKGKSKFHTFDVYTSNWPSKLLPTTFDYILVYTILYLAHIFGQSSFVRRWRIVEWLLQMNAHYNHCNSTAIATSTYEIGKMADALVDIVVMWRPTPRKVRN